MTWPPFHHEFDPRHLGDIDEWITRDGNQIRELYLFHGRFRMVA
jgi:hypothetical protein